MNLFDYVGTRIRELRAARGNLSQEALASAIGVNTNTVSRWETATYRPNLEDLDKLARFFGTSILEFLPQDDVPKNEKVNALLRAAEHLEPSDLEELQRYAEFRRVRHVLTEAKRTPKPRKPRHAP